MTDTLMSVVWYRVGQKPYNELCGARSQQNFVDKFGIMLAESFINISIENYARMWSKSNASGILFMHTGMMR